MKPIKQLPIKESLNELESIHKNCSSFLKPRIQMFIILSEEPVITKSQLARRLDVAYNSISKWYELYANGGIGKLMEVKRGKYRNRNGNAIGFSPDIYNAIERRHKIEPFQSYVELHAWVKDNHLPGIKYSTLIKYLGMYFGETLTVTRILELPIKESITDLQTIHARCLPRIKPRIEMLMTLKQNDKMSRLDLANKLNVSYGSIIKWSGIYREGGLEKLLEYKLTLVITPEVFTFIEKQFEQNKFQNFSELYRKVSKNYLPNIKYYTLHRYVHRHFKGELDAAKALNMPIKETVQNLQDMYSKCSAERKQRIRMLMLLKANPSYTKMELANLAGVAVGSIHRWCRLYKDCGLNSMLEMKVRGRKRLQLPTEVHSMIAKKIRHSPDMNITELHDWVTSFYKQGMTYNKLYRYVRRHFNVAPNLNPNGRMTDNNTLSKVA